MGRVSSYSVVGVVKVSSVDTVVVLSLIRFVYGTFGNLGFIRV